MSQNFKIIYYDGVCGLCNSWVQFILNFDNKTQFHFSALQSLYAKQHLPANLQNTIIDADPESIIYQRGDIFYQKTTAVILILADLKIYFKPLLLLLFIPSFIRNILYDLIAKYRYSFFGKYNSCKLPDKKWETRFLS